MGEAKTILFLCTGNYYRSRFAEALFNAEAQRAGLRWRADSRGLRLTGSNVGPVSHYAKDRLLALSVLCPSLERLPAPAREEDFALAHHIVAVKEAEHRPLMVECFPRWAERVEYWHIHDIDCALPDAALPELERHVRSLLERLRGLPQGRQATA
jgi:protein-tyrosine phosphatase